MLSLIHVSPQLWILGIARLRNCAGMVCALRLCQYYARGETVKFSTGEGKWMWALKGMETTVSSEETDVSREPGVVLDG